MKNENEQQTLVCDSFAATLSKAEAMYQLITELYPICRSITGNGVRQTLQIIKEHIPLEINEVESGKQVFDWKVPKEWNITDAYIKDSSGKRMVDFQESNLHILNYSAPVKGIIPIDVLKEHLHTIPEQPDLIPHRTSFYKETWGFCLSHNTLLQMDEESYEVCIDSTLTEGSLTYGELFIPGKSEEEILISTHTCHPSLCNDNLSGIAICTFLAKHLLQQNNRYSYRFIFIPATIGAITWLAENESKLKNIQYGFVASLLGDEGAFNYKRTKFGNTLLDKVVPYVLSSLEKPHQVIDFIPYGYDERQFSSPGINLPTGSLTRSLFGTFPEYHTSADNLDFVKPEKLKESLEVYKEVFHTLDHNRYYLNLSPKGEPQLGKRGLYNNFGGRSKSPEFQRALLWLLSFSDGRHSLLDIAERSKYPFNLILEAAEILERHHLLEEVM